MNTEPIVTDLSDVGKTPSGPCIDLNFVKTVNRDHEVLYFRYVLALDQVEYLLDKFGVKGTWSSKKAWVFDIELERYIHSVNPDFNTLEYYKELDTSSDYFTLLEWCQHMVPYIMLGDRVLIFRYPFSKMLRDSKIVIPEGDMGDEMADRALVISVGPDVMNVESGDTIVIAAHHGTPYYTDDGSHQFHHIPYNAIVMSDTQKSVESKFDQQMKLNRAMSKDYE